MTLAKLVKQAEKLVADNSPLILTAIGVTGTITTAVLASKATIKAVRLLDNEEYILETQDLPPLDIKEKVNRTWKLYVPAIGTGALTVVCIVGANRIGTRRAAAMAAAYSLSEKAFVEYKDKVVDKLGTSKEQKVRDEIAQDRVTANPVSTKEVLITGAGDVLCYDSITGRYFKSNMESLRKAENDINRQLLHDGYVTLHEFYVMIGLPSTLYSSEVGWNSDTMFELRFSTTMSDTNEPCIALEYTSYPIRDYYTLR
jgi:hypothetical protein